MKIQASNRLSCRLIVPAILVTIFCQPALGQGIGWQQALMQLQNYVGQVNAAANFEYYQGIPSKCFGNPFCAQQLLAQLNSWYMQQSGLVNNWYNQITMQCTLTSAPSRIPIESQTASGPGQIDEQAIEDIQVDDEDKTVRIKIPSTPKGFR